MTTLIHAPLACSLAVRFAAAEGDVPLNIQLVNLGTKEIETGETLYATNPLGQVSTLILDDGQILTENTAILTWLQAQSDNPRFRRDPADTDYFQMIRWIAFVSTELHKQILRVVFYDEATDAVKDRIRALAPNRFEAINKQLADKPYLLGDDFCAADAYLGWFLTLTDRAGLDLKPFPVLMAYQERVLTRPLIRDLLQSDRIKRNQAN